MWPNSQFPADLVTLTEEIFNGKLHFLYSAKEKNNKVFGFIKEELGGKIMLNNRKNL